MSALSVLIVLVLVLAMIGSFVVGFTIGYVLAEITQRLFVRSIRCQFTAVSDD